MMKMNFKRENFSSGIPLESQVGYSRMVKLGNYVRIGGTAAVNLDGTAHAPGDVYAQTKFIFERFLGLLEQAGASPADVYGIRAFAVNDVDDDFARAYAEYFKEYRPIATKYGIPSLGRPELRIEIELEAFIGSGEGTKFKRESFSSGIPLESQVGYSRMIKIGPYVRIGGTGAVNLDGTPHAPGDVYEQTKFIMERFLELLKQAGASPADVYGIRAFSVDDTDDAFGKAYSEYFGKYRPIATKIGVSNLHDPSLRIEIELEAFVGSGTE
jgi:enamine deaminase RidA (YjgF/YER057c/UK114 family)